MYNYKYIYIYNSVKLMCLSVTVALCVLSTPVFGINAKGVTPLDSWSFDKLQSKFKATLVKFDVAYPYGEKQEEFAKVGKQMTNVSDVMVAEVGVKDYGDRDNEDLAQKYKVKREEFPVIKLFIQGRKDPLNFRGTFKAESLIEFVREKAGVWVGLPGCLEVLDKLAATFKVSRDEERVTILKKAEEEWDRLQDEKERTAAEVYVKVMRLMLQHGQEFVDKESSRIKTLLKKKMSDDKKNSMKNKINILKSFRKEEL